MSKDEVNALCHAVKRSHWDPVIGIKMYIKRNPGVEMTPEHYAIAVGVGRTPFPSIKGLPEGPFPVYKNHPWFDARLWDSPEQREWENEMSTL